MAIASTTRIPLTVGQYFFCRMEFILHFRHVVKRTRKNEHSRRGATDELVRAVLPDEYFGRMRGNGMSAFRNEKGKEPQYLAVLHPPGTAVKQWLPQCYKS